MSATSRTGAIILGTGILALALFAGFLNIGNQPALITYAFTLDDKGQLPGESTGTGTVFEVQRSSYKNVSVTFDKKTKAHIQSITGMVGMRIAPSKGIVSTTVGNLEPNTTYYKYTDHLDTKEVITTDATGSVTFQQDISQEHYVMLFTHPSTYFLEDDATGRDCIKIGAWNGTTKTCTLNQDIAQSIEIKDNGITLNGANHTVQGSNSNIGVYVNGGVFGDITDVTVKDVIVKGFSKGIQINNTQNVHLINVTTSNNADGTEFYRAETSSIIGSAITHNTGKGLIVGTSSDINAITNNAITSNGVGIDLGLNSQSLISRNTITSNGNGIAVSAIGGDNTFLWQNNFDNTNEVSLLFDGDTQFYKDPPLRGNFWADHVCDQDPANKSFCTNNYLVKDRPLLADLYDVYPWACKDGWAKTCPVKTPPPTKTPTPTPGGTVTPTPPTSTVIPPVSFYTQVDPRWGSDIYDHSGDFSVKCGGKNDLNLTIRQCGCAITSVVNILSNYGITTETDGTEITPAVLNQWLNNNGGYTVKDTEKNVEGGALYWTAIDRFVRKRTDKAVAFHFGAFINKKISLSDVMSGIDSVLDSDTPVIANSFSGDHFFTITGKDGSRYALQDPSWYNTQFLDDTANASQKIRAYDNKARGYHYYEHSNKSTSISSIMMILGSPAELVVTDPNGKKIGYDPTHNQNFNSISEAAYWEEGFLQTDLIGSVQPKESKYLWIPHPVFGDYTVEVIGSGEGNYNLGVSYVDGNDDPHNFQFADSTAVNLTQSFILHIGTMVTMTQASQKVEICHVPPGNPGNAHTITVGKPALKAHLGHGDYEGACKNEKENLEIGEKKSDDGDNGKNTSSEKKPDQKPKKSDKK